MDSYYFYPILGTLTIIISSLLFYKRNLFYNSQSQISNKNNSNNTHVLIPRFDCSRNGLYHDMETTLQRPIPKLPISVDLPRLARKTKIYDGDNLLLDGTDPKYEFCSGNEYDSRAKLIELVWENIAKLVNEENENIKLLHKNLNSGDVAAKLGTFMSNYYTKDSKIIKILKVCNQSLLAPTVVRMKECIGLKYPYKDQRGQWIIIIRKINDNTIIVTHEKNEMSWEKESDYEKQHFEFSWKLLMELNVNNDNFLTLFRVTIDNIQFVDTVSRETKLNIIETMNSTDFIEPFNPEI